MRILWLKTELLHPVDKGGKIRTYHMLRALKREHHVTYLCLDDGRAASADRAVEYCHELIRVPHRLASRHSLRFYGELGLNLASGLPYALDRYRSDAMRRAIVAEAARLEFDVVVSDFLAASVNVPTIDRTVLFQHNVESVLWRRHAETADTAARRAFFTLQWKKMERFERSACRRFDAVVTVSEEDREVVRRDFGAGNVHAVPTGVDAEYFRPLGAVPRPGGMVFTGSMDWLPNEDAIIHFAEEILPAIVAEVPDARLTVVGREPSPRLMALARREPRIVFTGRVPDVRPYIDEAAAYVVPLRIGGGTRLKIYEAMAMEKPVISTRVGAEGLPVTDGDTILLADSPTVFASRVAEVLKSPALADRLGRRARMWVRSEFGWERAAAAFADVCASVGGKSPQVQTIPLVTRGKEARS